MATGAVYNNPSEGTVIDFNGKKFIFYQGQWKEYQLPEVEATVVPGGDSSTKSIKCSSEEAEDKYSLFESKLKAK